MNLRLTVENDPLSTARILCLDVVVVNLERCVGTGACQPYNVVFSIVHFDSHFTQTVIVRPNIIRKVQMAINLLDNKADESCLNLQKKIGDMNKSFSVPSWK
jgi:hypothetical protein